MIDAEKLAPFYRGRAFLLCQEVLGCSAPLRSVNFYFFLCANTKKSSAHVIIDDMLELKGVSKTYESKQVLQPAEITSGY